MPTCEYLCDNAIYKNGELLSHFEKQLPKILADCADDFIKG